MNPKLRVYDPQSRAKVIEGTVIEWVWDDGKIIQVYPLNEQLIIRSWPKDPDTVHEDEPLNEGTTIMFDFFGGHVRNIRIDPR